MAMAKVIYVSKPLPGGLRKWKVRDYSRVSPRGIARIVASGTSHGEAQAFRDAKAALKGRTKRNPETIDITPKWTGLMRWFVKVLEDPGAKESAKVVIREELMRLARFADEANVKSKARPLFNRRRR